MTRDRGLLRTRTGDAHHRVSFVELFFDLVFVFAVTQLSHSLIEHFSPIGAVQTTLLMLGVWWVWIYTTWFTNWLDPEKPPVRLAILAMMVAGLIMSASIPKAFESRGLAFAGAYASMQVGRTAFFLWAVRGHERMTRTFERILAWLMLTAVFWIAGGLAHGGERLALWALAIALDLVSPSIGFWVPGLGRSITSDWDVEGGHMAERCALFIIIALGESILVTGATFSALPWNTATVTAFVASFVGSLAMWWLYFDVGAELGSETISRSADPGRLARLAYTYIHLVLVAGIIVAAVADEFVLAHPVGHADSKIVITVLGSVALYLSGHALFAWSIAGRVPASSLCGIAGVAALAPGATHLSPVVLMTIATLVLIAVAMAESRVKRHVRWGTTGRARQGGHDG
ncbi:MAG TPA: low temperature requirement protein A [Vicinamibacterales bacterium]|nr:low temperature requirement protein A [Vicinamibacterales bacterium]